MALLLANSLGALDLPYRSTVTGGWSPTTSMTGRYAGEYAVERTYQGGAVWARFSFTPAATIIASVSWKATDTLSGVNMIPILTFFGDSGVTKHLTIGVLPNTGKVQVRRGDFNGTLLGESTSTVTHNTWYTVEVKATLSDTVGAVEVRVEGSTWVNVTGADTKNAGTATTFSDIGIGAFFNYAVAASLTGVWAHLTIMDTADGTAASPAQVEAFNDFPGTLRMQVIRPGGAGSSTQLTPTGSSTNYENVDDVPPVTTTWNSSGTSGHRDTYAMSNLSGTVDVLAVQPVMLAIRDNSGAVSMKQAIKSGATVAYGSNRTLLTTLSGFSDIWHKNPDTSAQWSQSEVDALEVGAEVV